MNRKQWFDNEGGNAYVRNECKCYVIMPTYKSGDGEYHEIVECGQELKKNIKTEIRKAMNDLKKDEKPVEEKQEVKPVPKRKPKAKSR